MSKQSRSTSRRWLWTSGVTALVSVLSMTAAQVSAQPAAPAKDGGAPAPSAKGAGTSSPAASAATSATAAVGDAGVAPASSAAPAPLGGDGGLPPPLQVPTLRKVAPPLPPPTKQQVDALNALKVEADAYEQGAKEYRDTVTTIIKLHYETKKRNILSGLDREIATEKEELRKARDTAILRLEEFIAKYSGARAHPEATPDAMYRLAALYEERARSEDAKDDLSIGLKPAIALYKRVIVEFPKYRELAGIYYFLGHAYNDSTRIDEAQQVWRSLVCHNKFAYPTPPDPKNPDADSIVKMPQDNTEEYWTAWRNRYPDPKHFRKGAADTKYIDPYPKDCEPIAQPALHPGEEPKYVAEVWWQIGNWEFDNLDMPGGVVKTEVAAVWDYNRAASAYSHSLEFKKPPLYGVALYKYSWTLFKQQRYEAATKEFVHLLVYTDEQQKLTGDPGADFRGEAYTYIAGSLTNIDFKGPDADEPFIQRPDIVDTEPRPEVAEAKLHIAIDRVKDPNLIPQDKPWTIEIYKALAQEYRSLNQFSNAVEVYEMILKKWPMDPSAPDVQNAIAETYDQKNLTQKVGTPEHDATAAKALEARTKLANYIGNTPWVDANKENPAAIQNAERLVKGGLRQAAAAHTNNGRQSLEAAQNAGDLKDQIELLSRAQAEYKLAALGWYGFIKQDENAPDVYESRYWLADARHKELRISVVLHKLQAQRFPEPTQAQIEAAKAAAIEVRDSNEDDKYLDNAAYFVVEESDTYRDIDYQRYDDSKGQIGIPRRDAVRFDNDTADKKVQKDPVPPSVLASMQARDEYIQRVPPSLDVNKRGLEYQFYVADMYFVYGQFDQARPRYEAIYNAECGKSTYGYQAWEKLISMSNMERDAERSRQLAEREKSHSCATSQAEKEKGALILNPTLQEAAFIDARKKFAQAKAAPPGPEKQKLWREAAGMYEAALTAAPARDEAPEAAMNAAYAYKQVGDFTKAIALYGTFIDNYGSEANLNKLQKGDANAKVAPDPKKYQERLGYLNTAYDELGTTYYGFFNYPKAAETYDKVASNERFDEAKRKTAAKNAMILYANMGNRDKMRAQYNIFVKLHPSGEEKANADFLVADFDHKQWNPSGPDTGTNRTTRQAAQASLAAFYNANKASKDASRYTLQAAYFNLKMSTTAGEKANGKTWAKNTIAGWEVFRSAGFATKDGKAEALTPPFSDYPAEAEFFLVDDDIKGGYETDRHKYTGATEDVVGKVDPKSGAVIKPGKYQGNAKEAEKYDERLQHIVSTYPSVEWVPAALARQGSIYDTLRSGLYNATTPPLKIFTPQQEKTLKQMEDSGRDDLMDKADEIRNTVKEGWRSKRDKELAAADEVMVRRYATAVALARQYNVRNPAVVHAIDRLAYFTDILGDAKMREYVTKTKDPNDPSKTRNLDYKDGQYVQSRPGLTASPVSSPVARPLPVAP
jgi:tetratricopeptide (TPR) repeat protein/outer membrane protein assembly factor BamD (BamD/ComL family)